jgi:hypothetical protein
MDTAAYREAIRHHRHYHQQIVNGVPPGPIRDCEELKCQAAVRASYHGRCPDGGSCHHTCQTAAACFRVQAAGPLSGVFPDDRWPLACCPQPKPAAPAGLEPDPEVRAAEVRQQAATIARELDNALNGCASREINNDVDEIGPELAELLEAAAAALREAGRS